MSTTSPIDPPARRGDWLLRVVGYAALLAVGIFPFAATGLLAPLWAVAVAWVMWFGTAVLTWRTSRRRPRLTPLVPLTAAAAWYVFILAAAAVFSWTP